MNQKKRAKLISEHEPEEERKTSCDEIRASMMTKRHKLYATATVAKAPPER